MANPTHTWWHNITPLILLVFILYVCTFKSVNQSQPPSVFEINHGLATEPVSDSFKYLFLYHHPRPESDWSHSKAGWGCTPGDIEQSTCTGSTSYPATHSGRSPGKCQCSNQMIDVSCTTGGIQRWGYYVSETKTFFFHLFVIQCCFVVAFVYIRLECK